MLYNLKNKKNYLLPAFFGWMMILIFYKSLSIVFDNDFGQVGNVNDPGYFILMIVLFTALALFVGGVLAWQAQKGKKWAKIFFIIFCIYHALDSVFMYFITGGQHEYSILVALLITIGWSLLSLISLKIKPNLS